MPDVVVVEEAQQEALSVVLSGFSRSFLSGPVTSLFAGLGVGRRLDEPPPQQTRPSPGQVLLSPAACTAQPLNQPLYPMWQALRARAQHAGEQMRRPSPLRRRPSFALPGCQAAPRQLGLLWQQREAATGSPGLAELTCQVLRPWKKKKRAKPHTTEVQTMQSRETSSRRSPLRSCRGESGQGGCLGEAPTVPEREAPPARVVAPS